MPCRIKLLDAVSVGTAGSRSILGKPCDSANLQSGMDIVRQIFSDGPNDRPDQRPIVNSAFKFLADLIGRSAWEVIEPFPRPRQPLPR
jgi:hypothetical protein